MSTESEQHLYSRSQVILGTCERDACPDCQVPTFGRLLARDGAYYWHCSGCCKQHELDQAMFDKIR